VVAFAGGFRAPFARLNGTIFRGGEALGAIGGGVLAATAGIRAPVLALALPTAAAITLLAWRHRTREPEGWPTPVRR
jgi:predicted MFS family arabinose efflux permease